MKRLPPFLFSILIAMMILLPVVSAATSSSDTANASQAAGTTRPTERAQTPAVPAPKDTPGEVVHPITLKESRPPATIVTKATPTRTATTTKVSMSPHPTGTTARTLTPATTATTLPVTPAPVVTVTVLVYRSSPVYWPYNYYPRNYPYSYDTSGVLTVTSNPSDAAVTLDGYNYGTTPYTFTGISPGYHTIEVNYPGYEAYISNVYLDNGQNSEVYADLVLLSSHGTLLLDSNPQGADVYVDGNYDGISPVTVRGLSEGTHQVELHLAGYEVATKTVQVTAGQGFLVVFPLQPLSPASVSGSVNINTNIPGALVYLDGMYRGSIQSGTAFSLVAVTPGSHELFLHLPGYVDYTQTVIVNAGQTTPVSASFSPLPTIQPGSPTAGSGAGSMVINTAPAGGQVTVDNVFRGVAPVSVYNVAAGSHIVNIHLAEFSDWSSSVVVPANQVVQVSATLTPAAGSSPSPNRVALTPLICAGALAIVIATAGFRSFTARRKSR